jgi:hypothetical protein
MRHQNWRPVGGQGLLPRARGQRDLPPQTNSHLCRPPSTSANGAWNPRSKSHWHFQINSSPAIRRRLLITILADSEDPSGAPSPVRLVVTGNKRQLGEGIQPVGNLPPASAISNKRTLRSVTLRDRFWPVAVLRMSGFEGQLTRHCSRSTIGGVVGLRGSRRPSRRTYADSGRRTLPNTLRIIGWPASDSLIV